jgi:GTP 3',8-cyclase
MGTSSVTTADRMNVPRMTANDATIRRSAIDEVSTCEPSRVASSFAVSSAATHAPPAPLRPAPLHLSPLPLVDGFGRVHRSLRISVTDRCNIRCQYCMPEVASFLPTNQLLTFEEIAQFVQIAATFGIRDVRITGGEPLMRPNLEQLLNKLRDIPNIGALALTTNGMLLADQLGGLVAAGLRRVNISLDTLNEQVFRKLSRRAGLDRVLAGIEAAASDPRLEVRLNALVMREVNYDGVLELIDFARQRDLPIRFIEFMPLDAERAWNRTQMVSGDEMRGRLSGRFGALVPLERIDPSQPSTDYTFADGRGIVGFIDSVSKPFCGGCDRLRLTAEGKLRNCLFGRDEWDVRELLRADGDRDGCSRATHPADREQAVESMLRACLSAKRAAHGIDAADFAPPERAMFQIGG